MTQTPGESAESWELYPRPGPDPQGLSTHTVLAHPPGSQRDLLLTTSRALEGQGKGTGREHASHTLHCICSGDHAWLLHRNPKRGSCFAWKTLTRDLAPGPSLHATATPLGGIHSAHSLFPSLSHMLSVSFTTTDNVQEYVTHYT